MTALAQLLDHHQAAALTRLQTQLLTATSAPHRRQATNSRLVTPMAATCPSCGQRRPAPAAVFRTAED